MPGERKVGDSREKSAPKDTEVPSGGDRTATSKREPVSKEADAKVRGDRDDRSCGDCNGCD